MIYLDNAATTFPKADAVYDEMDRVNRTLAINAGRGSYKAAREAERFFDDLRIELLKLFSAEGKADAVLTPSVTHALNQVLNGIPFVGGETVYISPYEHNAVARTLEALKNRYGLNVKMLPLKEDLSIDLDRTKFLFGTENPFAVICTAVSNVTGYVLPVEEIFRLAKSCGAVWTVCDAAQAAGLIEMNFSELNADVICFAGHKTLGGPFGIGGFILKKGMVLEKTLTGGTGSNSLFLDMPESAPGRYEASSPNIVAAAGLLASLKILDRKEHFEKVRTLGVKLFEALSDNDKVTVLGSVEDGVNLGMVSFVVEGYSADEVGNILDDEFDIAVRTGYHCAPYIHEFLGDIPYNGTVRASLGCFNVEKDIELLTEALESL